jgi:peroxiredoxin Q/BCP
VARIQRSTYLIGPDQKVVHVWKKVQVDGHDQEVIETIQAAKKT